MQSITETDENFTKAYQVGSGIPDWVAALKINGDFHPRYEGQCALPDPQLRRVWEES